MGAIAQPVETDAVHIKKGWGFMYNPVPKDIHVRLNAAKASRSAILVYMHLVQHLDGRTKSGWTIPQTDAYIGQCIGLAEKTVAKARKELVRSGFFHAVDYKINDVRLPGHRVFRILQTDAYSKTNKAKQQNKRERNLTLSREFDIPLNTVDASPQTGQAHLPEEGSTISPNRVEDFESQSPENPVIERVSENENHVCKERPIKTKYKEPPLPPIFCETLLREWNESHQYAEGEGEGFYKYFQDALDETVSLHAISVEQATDALIRAFHQTKHTEMGHPADYPTFYTRSEGGKRLLKSAVHHIRQRQTTLSSLNEASFPPSEPLNPSRINHADTEPTESSINSAAPPADLTDAERVAKVLAGVHNTDEARVAFTAKRRARRDMNMPIDDIPDEVIVEAWKATQSDAPTVIASPNITLDGPALSQNGSHAIPEQLHAIIEGMNGAA